MQRQSPSHDSMEIQYELPSTRKPTQKLRMERTGGGDLDFSIMNSRKAFRILVSRVDRRVVDIRLRISKGDVRDRTRETLESLFRGTIDIGGVIYLDNYRVTGTWVDAYIWSDSAWVRIASGASGAVTSLEYLVRWKLDAHLAKGPWYRSRFFRFFGFSAGAVSASSRD